ncbi:MAG: 2Fe-2S iron-sulfur cluster binding domain-containing protein [Cyclobacteriaceae bacterium]|nr:2Fe-2S iron-sulfur cluster binding domain-containing protein [Cyclobacteriaceae bacterium]
MNQLIAFKIDGKECMGQKGQNIADAARENGIYIPTLCHIQGLKPRGACRICSVRVNGRLMTACTTPIAQGMEVDSKSAEIQNLRKAIIELMFTEGNHFCPSCEQSGQCELQALAYRYQMLVPRFQFQFPHRSVEASHPRLIKDHNRCILCKRCIRAIKDEKGRSIFAFGKRGHHVEINIDTRLSKDMTASEARQASEICPVGAILLKKEEGFKTPIGLRKYDHKAIGSEVENS